eukprot:Colp12_sorted_trinity150504_noHs@17235
MGKKPFIDKKKAVHFRLVHRSQRDPLAADNDAPQRVLMPVGGSMNPDLIAEVENEFNGPDEDEEEVGEDGMTKTERDRHSVLATYGIGFEDDYDYMQHLREPGQPGAVWLPAADIRIGKKKTVLPSEAFASEYEEEVGLLNRAAPESGPRLDWDPDVVALLDTEEAPEQEWELDDDFISKAMGEGGAEDDEEEYGASTSTRVYSEQRGGGDDEEDYGSEDDDVSTVGGGSQGSQHSLEETRSRFTEYSMTSSVMRRNQGLQLIDDRFERMMEEYDDDEIGELTEEDIERPSNLHRYADAVDKFYRHLNPPSLAQVMDGTDTAGSATQTQDTAAVRQRTKEAAARQLEGEEENVDEQLEKLYLQAEEKEQKKARKQAIKEERRTKRETKKALKEAFKTEAIRQERQAIRTKKVETY